MSSKKVTDIKSQLKAFVPAPAKKMYRKIKLKKMYNHEMSRYFKYYSSLSTLNEQQVKAMLVFYSHALEKGLSHIEFRYSFGESALRNLHTYLEIYRSNKFSKQDKAYINTLSCLKAYKIKHEEFGKGLPNLFIELFDSWMPEVESVDNFIGGYSILDKSKKENNRSLDFKNLFNNRVSIREYSSEPVDIELVKEAIQISMKTPSVCNRQASRVRIIVNPNLIELALKAQGGYSGYKPPSMLLLITTDSQSFVDIKERNQIYIDGGLFSMSLLTSIEYVGLAACALNAMFTLETEKKVRDVLDIPDNENFIMFITVGNYLDKTPYPKSFRYSASEITKVL